jgi:hypothetical protein
MPGEREHVEGQFPCDHRQLRSCLGSKCRAGAKLAPSPVLAGGQGGKGSGKGTVIVFLCSHIYLAAKMGPEFGNWKSSLHHSK